MSILSTLPIHILSDSVALNNLLEGSARQNDWKLWAFGSFARRDATRPDHVFHKRWEMFEHQGGCAAASISSGGEVINLRKALELVTEGYLELQNGRLYVRTDGDETEGNPPPRPVADGADEQRKYHYSSAFSRWQNIRARMTTLPLKMLLLYRTHPPTDFILAHPYSAMTADYIRREGLNETHLHLNGCRYPEEEWLTDMRQPMLFLRKLERSYRTKESIRELYYNINPTLTPREAAARLRLARILRTAVLLLEAHHPDTEAVIEQTYSAIRLYAESPLGSTPEMPWVEVPSEMKKLLRQEMQMWMGAFSLLEDESDFPHKEVLQRFLHLYLLIENEHIQLNYHTENRKGFASFDASLGHDKLSVGDDAYYRQTFYRLLKVADARGDNCIEVRLAPVALREKNIKFVSLYRQAWERRVKEREQETRARGFEPAPTATPPQLILVAHFIKRIPQRISFDARLKLLPPLYGKERRNHLREAIMVARVARMLMKKQRVPVAVDAANSEMNQPPEVFALPYRAFEYVSRSSHKTYHCGEDFLHLISGIRAVYEAVLFLNLRNGNRIGHGVSIGIHPQQWLNSMPSRVILSRRDWLLDMIFAWKLLHDCNPSAAEKAEKEAMRMAHLIFGSTSYQHPSIHALEELFDVRIFDPTYTQMWSRGKPAMTAFRRKEWMMMNDYAAKHGKAAFALYWCWNTDWACRREQDELIEVPKDYLSVGELLQMQQRVQHLLARRDVVIETLPVSNLRISQYRDIQEHHLLRWLQVGQYAVPGDAHLNVCMGSDDPGIFSSDIKNEFYHLLMLLRNSGLTEAEALEKMKQVNQAGRIYAFRELPDMPSESL